jgi:aldose 1-epimerase
VPDGIPMRLASRSLEATFLPDVGMLGSSLRHEGEELLALPGGVAGYRARHQTGLPLLAPWANRLGGWTYEASGVAVNLDGLDLTVDENHLPIHGTLTAASGWRVVSAEADRLRATFDYGCRPELLAAFPFPHLLEVDAVLDATSLTVVTTLHATGDRSVPVSFGWHPYLRLPGLPRQSWRLCLPAREHAELDAHHLPTGTWFPEPLQEERLENRALDDLYALGYGRVMAIEGGGWRISVLYGDGYRFAQVFSPPGRDFVCLEPMTAPTNALVTGEYEAVEPSCSFSADFSIRVERV